VLLSSIQPGDVLIMFNSWEGVAAGRIVAGDYGSNT